MCAQKITLGTCTTKDGGEYSGEMVGGKPQGKGKATYKNGNRYEGSYVKGKRQGYGIYTFFDGEKYEGPTEKNTKDSGFRTSSTGEAHTTLPTTTSM